MSKSSIDFLLNSFSSVAPPPTSTSVSHHCPISTNTEPLNPSPLSAFSLPPLSAQIPSSVLQNRTYNYSNDYSPIQPTYYSLPSTPNPRSGHSAPFDYNFTPAPLNISPPHELSAVSQSVQLNRETNNGSSYMSMSQRTSPTYKPTPKERPLQRKSHTLPDLKPLEAFPMQNRKHKRRTMKQIGIRTCFVCKTKSTTRWRLGWFYLKNADKKGLDTLKEEKMTEDMLTPATPPNDLESDAPPSSFDSTSGQKDANNSYALKCVDLCNPCGLAYRRRRSVNSFSSPNSSVDSTNHTN